jgi:hypothetical protein
LRRVAYEAYQRSIASFVASSDRTAARTSRRSAGGIAPGFFAGASGGSRTRSPDAAAVANAARASFTPSARKPTEYVTHAVSAIP